MTNVNVTDIPILELLPQRRPFVMVDRVTAFDRLRTVTEFLVTAECIFVEDNVLSPDGMVENIAQTCAARMGCINHMNGENVKLGFIGAVKDMAYSRLPRTGEELTTSIIVREEVFRMTLVDAEIRVGEEVIATAEMKIALSEIEASEN